MRLSKSLALVGSHQFEVSGRFDCPVYAMKGPEGVVLIDAGAGTDTGQLLENLRDDLETDSVKALIVAHGHLDHSGGMAEIRKRTSCQVIGPELSRSV